MSFDHSVAPQVTIHINGEPLCVKKGLKTGNDLLAEAKLGCGTHLLLDLDGELDIPIESSDYIIIDGGERFAASDRPPPYGKNPCLKRALTFTVNSADHQIDHAKVKAAYITGLVPGHVDRDGLFTDLPDFPDELIPPGATLVLQGGERFVTAPCGNVGEASPILLSHLEELQRVHPESSLESCGGNWYLLMRNVPLPPGWNHEEADMLFVIPNRYPAAGLDMFYISPALSLPDGTVPDRATVCAQFLGRTWQRFSWHYNPQPWNPCTGSLKSHYYFCQQRLLGVR